MQTSALLIAATSCLIAAVMAAPLHLQARPSVPIRVRYGSSSIEFPGHGKLVSEAGNFTPSPPPIHCDDFYVNNGVACLYVVNAAKKLVTPLLLGNVSMPDKNPHFVVDPPKEITNGGWFSFRDLLDWANQTTPVDPWAGYAQYSSKDAAGNTYIFRADFTFAGGTVDIGLAYPEKVGIDVKPEVKHKLSALKHLNSICQCCGCSLSHPANHPPSPKHSPLSQTQYDPQWVTGFQIVDA
jgi:hypothetical protein